MENHLNYHSLFMGFLYTTKAHGQGSERILGYIHLTYNGASTLPNKKFNLFDT